MTGPEHAYTRVRGALGWTSALRLFTRGLGIVTMLVVARLIPPEEYGVFAAVAIVYQTIMAVTDLSVTPALVQMRQDPRPYLNTAWTVGVARGVAVFALLEASAPFWADLFHVPEATPLLRVLAVVALVTGLHNVGTIILGRELRFGRLVILHAAEAVGYSVTAIAAGAILHNAWALVLAALAAWTLRVAASYVLTPLRGGFGFQRRQFAEMFAFSRWTSAYGVVDLLLETFDNAVVARLAGPRALGFYRMAYQLATEAPLALQWVVASVAFPAVASIQHDADQVRRSYRGLLGLASSVLIPVSLLFVILAEDAIPLLLGPSWAPTAEPLRVLAIAGLVRGILATLQPVLLGLGRSRQEFTLRAAQAAVMVALVIVAGTSFGVIGVAWAVLLASLLTLPLWLRLTSGTVGVGTRALATVLAAPTIAGSTAAIATIALPAGGPDLAGVIARVATFSIAYLAASALLLRVLPGSGLGAAARALR